MVYSIIFFIFELRSEMNYWVGKVRTNEATKVGQRQYNRKIAVQQKNDVTEEQASKPMRV